MRDWGEATARRTRARLEAQLERIGSGVAIGHRRPELPPDSPIRFVNEPPFVIAYHAHTRVIVRIVHGRRDLTRLFRR